MPDVKHWRLVGSSEYHNSGYLRMAPTGRNSDDSRFKTRDFNTASAPLMSKSNWEQREPPPMLFLHPSPGTSHVSLPGILAPGAPVLDSPNRKRELLSAKSSARPRLGSAGTAGIQRPGRNLRTADSTRSADRIDALWAEMQATLEEVELSASGGIRVFGPGHDHKLAELRAAQIALAQAWARSEADDAIETTLCESSSRAPGDEVRSLKGARADASRSGAVDGADAPATNAGRPNSSGGGGADRHGANIEDETELDILLARKRREANDQYFQRVNNGVIDVVAKLEDVAVTMRAVERESKDESTSLSDDDMA